MTPPPCSTSWTSVRLVDVNVLLYAHKEGSEQHEDYRAWLTKLLQDDAAFGMSELVLASFVRIATHPRVFDPPSSLDGAFAFVRTITSRANHVAVRPGPRHWSIFERLCGRAGAKGNLVTDAYLAALAIESGSEWITTDRDFARFEGLHWRHPLTG